MSDPLLALVQRVVQEMLARLRGPLLGEVTATYPHGEDNDANNYEVDVRLKHEDLTLYRVPVALPFVGLAAPPQTGAVVLVHFLDGDLNQPLIAGSFYHADEPLPLYRDGEILLEQRLAEGKLNHIRLAADGSIYIQQDVIKREDSSEAAAGIVIRNGGEITITCTNLKVTGNTAILGKLEVGETSKTTIIGNQIQGS